MRRTARLHPKAGRLAPCDSAKMRFGGLELTWRGARDRLQGCKRGDEPVDGRNGGEEEEE